MVFCHASKRDLERIAFKTYIHPQGDFQNGYYDICDIEKGTFDCDNMKLGEVYPVILYAHHETMLTVGCVVKTSDHPDVVTGEEHLLSGSTIQVEKTLSHLTQPVDTFTKINYGTH